MSDWAYRSPEVKVMFLGQMGVRISVGGRSVYIDPFLSDHPRREFPSVFSPSLLTDALAILGTHDHKDHIDREAWPAVAKESPQTLFVVPELLIRAGLPRKTAIEPKRFLGLNDRTECQLGGVRVTGIASAHEFLDFDVETGLFPYLGYVIEVGGMTIYHAGDTCRYEGLVSKLSRWDFDLMILPINGRDAVRYESGCIGNMTYQEAADLAGELKPKVVIPGHWDMFSHNSENPELFTEYCRVKYPDTMKVMVLKNGQEINLSKYI